MKFANILKFWFVPCLVSLLSVWSAVLLHQMSIYFAGNNNKPKPTQYIYPEDKLPSKTEGWIIAPRSEGTLYVVAQTKDKSLVTVVLTTKTRMTSDFPLAEYEDLDRHVNYAGLYNTCQASVANVTVEELLTPKVHEEIVAACTAQAIKDLAQSAPPTKIVVTGIEMKVIVIPADFMKKLHESRSETDEGSNEDD